MPSVEEEQNLVGADSRQGDWLTRNRHQLQWWDSHAASDGGAHHRATKPNVIIVSMTEQPHAGGAAMPT